MNKQKPEDVIKEKTELKQKLLQNEKKIFARALTDPQEGGMQVGDVAQWEREPCLLVALREIALFFEG